MIELLDPIVDADHPTRMKLITEFPDKREALLLRPDASPECKERLAQIERMLQILADQVEPS